MILMALSCIIRIVFTYSAGDLNSMLTVIENDAVCAERFVMLCMGRLMKHSFQLCFDTMRTNHEVMAGMN